VHYGSVDVALVLFTRDLRVRDNPALARACARARAVLPLFVVDPALAVPPNRARMITASFLTKTLGIDWRHGYRHFAGLLADGDVANNAGNWQWVAGTGNNPRPGRVHNPLRQAERFDRDGGYVRRYVPELASLEAPLIHTPWKLPEAKRRRLGYPGPVTAQPTMSGLAPRAPA
jgi:deoxyribodipyrimidine photolyase